MRDDKYRHLENEVGGVKADISDLKTDLASVQTNLGILGQSYHSLKAEMGDGFRSAREDNKSAMADIKAMMSHEENQPPSIKVSLLIGMIGILFPTLAASGAVILLLFNPLKEKVGEIAKAVNSHASKHSHEYAMTEIPQLDTKIDNNDENIDNALAVVSSESAERHAQQATQITGMRDRLVRERAESRESLRRLLDWQLKTERELGTLAATDLWLRDDVEATKDDLIRHDNDTRHPGVHLAEAISSAQAKLEELSKEINRIDIHGSTGTNLRLPKPATLPEIKTE